MTKHKALFYDIDGTICFSKGVYPENIEAFARARELGHKIFINSGRARAFIPQEVLDAAHWDGFLCGSAYIEIDGKVILNETISESVLLKLRDFADMANVPMLFEGVDGVYAYKNDLCDTHVDDNYEDFARNSRVTKLSFFCPTKLVTPYVHDEHIDGIPEMRIIVFPHYCEAIISGHTKATALRRACDYVGIDVADSVAFGDSENDLDMLRAAGTAVVMPRAPESLKAIADYIPPEDHRGCAIAMKELGII